MKRRLLRTDCLLFTVAVALGVVLVFDIAEGLAQQPRERISGEIRGVVKDVTGKAMPGVDVGIVSRLKAGYIQQIKTDAKGQFAFRPVPPGEYGVPTSKEGYSATSQKVIVQAGKVSSLEVILRQIMIGKVISSSSSSITVSGRTSKPSRINDPPEQLTFVITGQTRIVGSPISPDDAVRVEYRPDQITQTNVAVEIMKRGVQAQPAPSTTPQPALAGATEVIGVVVDDAGNKVPGADILLVPISGARGGRPTPIARAKTNESGEFRLTNIPPGTYTLEASLRFHGGTRLQVPGAVQPTIAQVVLKQVMRPAGPAVPVPQAPGQPSQSYPGGQAVPVPQAPGQPWQSNPGGQAPSSYPRGQPYPTPRR